MARGLPKVGMRSARGWHEVCPRLHEVYLRSAQGCTRLHEVCPRLPKVGTRSAQGWHEVARGLPEVGSNWLFPHHPIPNAKFQPITRSALGWHEVCPRLARGLPEVGTRSARGCTRSHEVSPRSAQGCTRSAQGCPRLARGLPEVGTRLPKVCPRWHEVGSNWLFPHHPIPNAKFQPIMRSA